MVVKTVRTIVFVVVWWWCYWLWLGLSKSLR